MHGRDAGEMHSDKQQDQDEDEDGDAKSLHPAWCAGWRFTDDIRGLADDQSGGGELVGHLARGPV